MDQLSALSQIAQVTGTSTVDGLDFANFQDGQRVGGSSNRQFVRFYRKIVPQVCAKEVSINPKTQEVRVLSSEVREIEREFVEIITPGDKNTVDDFAQDFHRREHFRQYKAFRDGRTAPIGTPVEECSFIPQPVATELKYLGIQTVEQLADASEIVCGRLPNGFDLREYARATVQANTDNKSLGQVNALKSELQKAQEMIANLQSQMTNVRAETQEITQEIKRGRGRPKKEEITQVTE